jgi:hypothetical protein
VTTAYELKPLAPLARTIAETVRDTPIRLGSPDGAADLVAMLTVKVAAYVGGEMPATSGVARHMAEVDAERQRQLKKWGDQTHPDGTGLHPERQQQLADEARTLCDRAARDGFLTWSHILMEEVREAMAEEDPTALRAELVQCAAVIAAWILDIDRRAGRAV